jgi:hypothetical protein
MPLPMSQVMQSAAESALGGPLPQHMPGRLANVSQVPLSAISLATSTALRTDDQQSSSAMPIRVLRDLAACCLSYSAHM